MAHNSHSPVQQQVPSELLATHQAGWNHFTQATVIACFATAVIVIITVLFVKFF